MGIHAHKQRPRDTGLLAVLHQRLGHRQNVGFGEGAVQGAAAVTGGAEGDPLLRAAHVRLVEVVGADQTGNVGQIAKTSRLTGVGMLCHGVFLELSLARQGLKSLMG